MRNVFTFKIFLHVFFFFNLSQINSLMRCHFSLKMMRRVLVIGRVSDIMQDVGGCLPIFFGSDLDQILLQLILFEFRLSA